MKYLSVCSGIEAATVAWHSLGWKPFAFSEIEPFPSAVLAHYWPHVPNLGDMTKHHHWQNLHEVDLLVGGTPCQAFSIAGLRNSLADERGNLTLTYVKILNQIDEARISHGRSPALCLWENVPGVLNTEDNAFGCFLAALAGEELPLLPPGGRWTDAGYVRGPQRSIAWRVMDAQYFGLAQRRRRVFVIASPRDGACPAEILFEFQGMQRHSPPSRSQRQTTPLDSASSTGCGMQGQAGNPRHPTATIGQTEKQQEATTSIGFEPIFIDRAAFNQGANAQFDPVIREGGVSDALVARGPHAVCTGFRMAAFGEYAEDNTASTIKQRDYKDATDLVVAIPYQITTCDANGTRQDRPNGGLYITENPEVSSTLTQADNGVRVVSFSEGFFRCGGGHAPREDGTCNTIQCNTGDQRISVAYRTTGNCGAYETGEIVDALTTGTDRSSHVVAFRACGQDGFTPSSISPPLMSSDGGGTVPSVMYAETPLPAIAFAQNTRDEVRIINGDGQITGALAAEAGMKQQTYVAFSIREDAKAKNFSATPTDTSLAITAQRPSTQSQHAQIFITENTDHHYAVRRLTPTECERLQGFPDGHTQIPTWNGWRYMDADETPEQCQADGLEIKKTKSGKWRVKDSDGPRYKALGNSMAVPCMHWLGQRIQSIRSSTAQF